MAAEKLELRRLELADLDAIEEIERVSYRTPWSRSMFASELARDEDDVAGCERVSIARTLLEDVDALLRQASARPADLDALAVGTGPGSFTSTRLGIAVARGLGVALGVPGAGVSTLDALRAGAGEALAVIDARRASRPLRPARRARRRARVRPRARAACS